MPSTSRKRLVSKSEGSVTAISSFYSSLLYLVSDVATKKGLAICAPIAGYVTFILWKFIRSNVNLWHYEYKTKKYIRELEEENANLATTSAQRIANNRAIKNYKDSLNKKRTEDLDII